MNGGKLIQNISNHATFGTHQIYGLIREDVYDITSTHHQMQYPFNLKKNEYSLLYVSPRRSDFYEGDGIDIPNYEPEIVLYHKKDTPRCLAIQGHPEIMRLEAPVIDLLNKLIDKYILC